MDAQHQSRWWSTSGERHISSRCHALVLCHAQCHTIFHRHSGGLVLGLPLRTAIERTWDKVVRYCYKNLDRCLIYRTKLANRSSIRCALAQSATLLGAVAEGALAPYLGPHILQALLAIAGGSFLYLGWHAVHGEFRRSGASPALVPAPSHRPASEFRNPARFPQPVISHIPVRVLIS